MQRSCGDVIINYRNNHTIAYMTRQYVCDLIIPKESLLQGFNLWLGAADLYIYTFYWLCIVLMNIEINSLLLLRHNMHAAEYFIKYRASVLISEGRSHIR